jgi:hypothetical protein
LNRINRRGDGHGRGDVAEPPAGHRVGFAETVDGDRNCA